VGSLDAQQIQFHPDGTMTTRSRLQYLALVGVIFSGINCDRSAPTEQPDSIWYSHQGCYGSCPAFDIRVSRDTHGTFEGRSYTAVKGQRQLSVTPEQFAAFVRALDSARRLAKPFDRNENIYEQINADFSCPPTVPFHTDDSGVFIVWWARSGNVYYSADFGCERNKNVYDAVEKAPQALGLKPMIGEPNPMTPP
jgi:hypothetical protein